MNTAVILLGSNLGDRMENLNKAVAMIGEKIGTTTLSSNVYATEPWGKSDQPEYYNQVIAVRTSLEALTLMNTLLDTEVELGRTRTEKWEPRLIDIDILYYNKDVIKEKGLTVPHPHLHERRFTLEPLVEILPDYIHPVLMKKNSELLERLNDNLRVNVLTPIKTN